jgi:hypothetical protein
MKISKLLIIPAWYCRMFVLNDSQAPAFVLQMGKLSALVVTSVVSDNLLHHGSSMVLQIMNLLVLGSSGALCACIEFLINLGWFQTRCESLTTHECSKRPDWLWYLHAAADWSVRIPDPWTTSRFKSRFLWIVITHFLSEFVELNISFKESAVLTHDDLALSSTISLSMRLEYRSQAARSAFSN